MNKIIFRVGCFVLMCVVMWGTILLMSGEAPCSIWADQEIAGECNSDRR